MRRTFTWLVTLPFAAASVLVGHALAYRLTGTPMGNVHGYLEHVPQVVFILASVAVLGLAADTRARRRSPLPLAALAVVSFACRSTSSASCTRATSRSCSTSPVSGSGSCCRRRSPSRSGSSPAGSPRTSPSRVRAGCPAARPAAAPPRSAGAGSGRPAAGHGPSRPRSAAPLLTSSRRASSRGPHRTQEIQMRKALVLAVALVAIAVPTAASAARPTSRPSRS